MRHSFWLKNSHVCFWFWWETYTFLETHISHLKELVNTNILFPLVSYSSLNGKSGLWMVLRIFQHTPGTYPRPPINSLCRNSFHFGVLGWLGYAPRVCWGFLRMVDFAENLRCEKIGCKTGPFFLCLVNGIFRDPQGHGTPENGKLPILFP